MPDFESVAACFLHNDGSLPGIELHFSVLEEIPKVFEFLMARSEITTSEASFWDTVQQCDTPVVAVPNAAALVIEGKAEGFRICVTGLLVSGVELPELGIFVFRDSMELDWRMGPEWTETTILAFFELLHQLGTMAPSLQLEEPSIEGPPSPEAFFAFREAYEEERRQKPPDRHEP